MPDDNPILNNPYEEPIQHYATNFEGELDYTRPLPGRRLFTPDIQGIPVQNSGQAEVFSFNEMVERTHGSHLVNLLRKEVSAWRQNSYPQTTRITRELLHFWFLNPERDHAQQLFFAQREAIEIAIFLNEVAEKSNVGQHILRQLEEAQRVSHSAENNLPRVAFKMATGTGKTVVMAALITYHFFNRSEYRNDTRFADYFLIVAPGVTIRDRLSVLRVDPRLNAEAEDYYYTRHLVPKAWRGRLLQLNNKLVITNYHAFEPKTLQGNKRSPFDGKIDPATGKKREEKEEFSHVLKRLLGQFKPHSRLLILNDEAHHCYLPRESQEKAEGEDIDTENERAAVWFNGIRQIALRYKVRSVYDLSATPYFLTGSGYEAYKLFPWVVSDFGLIEAIESGLVKIPFLPTRDDTQELGLPILRNLYEHVRDELPKAGQRKQRARARESGQRIGEAPPKIPPLVKTALEQFYHHYAEEFSSRVHSLGAQSRDQLEMEDTPPVFILVCNNTSVSREIYKYIAGYEIPSENEGEPPIVYPGACDLFSNYDEGSRQPRQRPPTLLIDSDALENSGQISDDFKKIFAPEITRFKREHARVHGQGSAEDISDAEILREVVNTVGKRNALGAHVRCVVSVSMLTEGWDANTVTHIMGLRRFGSQLLCEQVAGRALRRRSYRLQSYDKQGNPTSDGRKIATWKFPPEYAHIIGVPFKLFKGGRSTPPPPDPLTRVFALSERAEASEIHFPNVEGYRLEYDPGPLRHDFSTIGDYEIDGSAIPIITEMANAVSPMVERLTLEDALAIREQRIIYRIAKDLLRDHFSSDPLNPEFHRFLELKAIVEEWYHTKVRVLGRDPSWKKLLYFRDPKGMVASVANAIQTSGETHERIRPILNYYNPEGSSRFVHGQTSRDTYPTRHSHVNVVVVDSGWEGKAAKVLDDLAEEGLITSWVKNSFLDFKIPYTDAEGKDRFYFPDFIIRALSPAGDQLHLMLEITGMNSDKAAKTWAVRNRWLPAINQLRAQRNWPRWDFLEIADDIRDARNQILASLTASEPVPPAFGLWKDEPVDALAYQESLRKEWED